MIPILYEDGALLVVEKPAGMVTHPAYRHPDGTLCDAVFARQAERGEGRPWLLHRLDRETSGVVVFAKTDEARRGVVRQFERHLVRKRYVAVVMELVSGCLAQQRGILEARLRRDPADRRRTIVDEEAGQPATTRYAIVARAGSAALVLAEPLTGRTHQIRAHLAHLGAPLAGDARYIEFAGQRLVDGTGHTGLGVTITVDAPRVMLHAWRLGMTHPVTRRPFEVEAPLPQDLRDVAHRLGLGDGLVSIEQVAGDF